MVVSSSSSSSSSSALFVGRIDVVNVTFAYPSRPEASTSHSAVYYCNTLLPGVCAQELQLDRA